jgi:hypothetical protein
MRNPLLCASLACLVLGCASLPATTVPSLNRVSRAEAERLVTSGAPEVSSVAMWMWSDKYVYQPGEALTMKWTVMTNGERYPYTVVAYRQNNQTGVKTYLPSGSIDATDIFGRTADDGFQPLVLPVTTKGTLIGSSSLLGPVTIPEEYGMHTFVLELRDYTGNSILKTVYMKIGVISGFENVTGNIESDRTLVNSKAYNLSGIVFVRNNATLTIEPGTFIFGQPGSEPPSALIVTRNGKINAAGTRSRPIVMTSSLPFGDRNRGDWGGLVLLGKAPINVGANTSGKNNQAGQFYTEGLPASEDSLFGGTDPNHSCGVLSYVRVEYAGSILSPNNELNSFTFSGCGKGTVAHHLQAIYGLDDSFEWFGGTMDAKYLVGGLGADDYVDFQLGFTGRIQFGVFYQSPDHRGNRGIEGDNSEYDQAALPLSSPTMFNLTFVGSGQPGYDEPNAPGIYLRRGAGGSYNNIVVSNFYSSGVFVDGTATQAQIDNGNLKMNGILLWNNGQGANAPETLDGQVDASTLTFAQGARGSGKNFVVTDPLFTRPFVWSDPDWRGMFLTPLLRAGWVAPPDDGFFDQSAKFIGGIGNDNWMEEWTSFLNDDDIKP